MRRFYIEYLGDFVELPLGETIIGRDIGCMLRFNDPAVSRRHLRFVRQDHEVTVEDLHSSNGTLVNGERLKRPRAIADGDSIKLGTRELTVRTADNAHPLPSTLVLDEEAPGASRRASTSKIPITAPPPFRFQRCPECGAAVSPSDEVCGKCGHRWDEFRPKQRTDVKKNPLLAQNAIPGDRRAGERRFIELTVLYVSRELEIEATTQDLSTSGVFVCTQVLDPIGTRCQLTLLVDGGPPLAIAGLVRRVVEAPTDSEPVGLGVEFLELGPAALSWLEVVLERASTISKEEPVLVD
ncbi:MAG: FHA domain-containing protein [Kofleriaceae bacterium]